MREKNQIAIYGAGKLAKKLLPLLQREYEIEVILDRIQGGSGTSLCGVNIVKPDIQNVNSYPVVITVADVNSCVATLKELGCQQEIYACVPYLHGFAIFECNEAAETMGKSKIVLKERSLDISFRQTSMKTNPSERRYIMLGSCDEEAFFSATGGPTAGLRFLWDVNNRLKMIDNFYIVMPGLVFMPQDVSAKGKIANSSKRARVLSEDGHARCSTANYNEIVLDINIDALKTFLEYVVDVLGFSSNDVFLCLDTWIAYAFMKAFPRYPNLVLAYHAQGVLSTELRKSMPELCDAYDAMQMEQLQHIKEWIFPTRGAADGFLQSANEAMRRAAKTCHFNVLYSSYEPKKNIRPDASFVEELNTGHDYDVMFASATFLYKNKGVERIPRILASFKKQTGLRIKWVLVGGGEMEQEVEDNLYTYLAPEDYGWYKKRFDNQDNIFALFEKSDFYIMMHRISVSDLSTMQAMAYGCVPFLSNVGGNLEFCGFENGILIDPETDVLPLGEYVIDGKLNREYLEQKKECNRRVIREKFNEVQFLSGYRDFMYSIQRGQ